MREVSIKVHPIIDCNARDPLGTVQAHTTGLQNPPIDENLSAMNVNGVIGVVTDAHYCPIAFQEVSTLKYLLTIVSLFSDWQTKRDSFE